MELLRDVAVESGRAVVVVTHDSRVFEFGDRIAHGRRAASRDRNDKRPPAANPRRPPQRPT